MQLLYYNDFVSYADFVGFLAGICTLVKFLLSELAISLAQFIGGFIL